MVTNFAFKLRFDRGDGHRPPHGYQISLNYTRDVILHNITTYTELYLKQGQDSPESYEVAC